MNLEKNFGDMRIKLCNLIPVCSALDLLQSTTHLPTSKPIYQLITQDMPSKPSTKAKLTPQSPPRTRMSARKRALSSTSIAEPPAKKVATGDGEEAEESQQKGGKRGKGTRCVTYI